VRTSLSGGDNGQVTVDLGDSRIAEVCRRCGVAELSVFGSVARGEDTDSSDVDLLYVLAPDSTLGFEIVDLRDELEMIVGRRVDLVPKSRLKWVIRDRVLAEARVLYAA
jgi:predicted nucleotidyltransferase